MATDIRLLIVGTGGMANKKMNPNLPTQPQEIADVAEFVSTSAGG